jgi:hypothetical protein
MEYPPLYLPEQMRQHEVRPNLSVAPQNAEAMARVMISLAQRAPQVSQQSVTMLKTRTFPVILSLKLYKRRQNV